MTSQQLVFLVIAAIILVSGFSVVTSRNLFHAAIAMMVTFFGVAGFYALLDMGFLAAAQLLVYIGAISILILFAIMMTRRLMQTTESPFNSQVVMAGIASVALAAILLVAIIGVWPFGVDAAAPLAGDEVISDSLQQLGTSLVDPDGFVLPFEIASVLLLAALVGSVFIAWPEKQ